MAQNQQKHLTFILVPEARMKMRKKGNQGDMKMGKSKENTYIYMYMYIYIYIIYIYIYIYGYVYIYMDICQTSGMEFFAETVND